MAHRVISASVSPGEIRVALVQDGCLADYGLWRPGSPDGFGDVHIGRVIACVPALAGCFVVLDGDQEGFLPDSAGGRDVTTGEIIAVQVSRAAQGGKGPRLARCQGPAVTEGKPRLLSRGADPLRMLAARYPEAPIEIDDPTLIPDLRRELGSRLRVVAEAFPSEIEETVAALSEISVSVPGGAALYIQPTRALTAIDIDSAAMSATRQTKTAAQAALNQAILPELARQIMLRNLGGAIVVDLAGMPVRRRAALAPALAAALAPDPLQPRLLGFTALGLAEISRPRQRPPLHELLRGSLATGLSALRAACAHPPTTRLRLRAAPAIIAALEADGVGLAAVAHRLIYKLSLRSDPSLAEGAWNLEAVA